MTRERRAAPLHRSVFGRLVAVMLAVAVAILAIVAAFFAYVVGPGLGSSIRRVVGAYARQIAATGPDLARAREIRRAYDIETRYEGPDGSWSTEPSLPAIAEVERAWREDRGPSSRWSFTIVDGPRGGRYLFGWGHYRRMRVAHDGLLVLMSALIVGVLGLAWAVIRRSLRPLRSLHEGVSRLSEGQLDVAVPDESRDEFGVLAAAFNAMAARVAEMVRARDRLLVDVSHELRSPLTRLKVALALLPDDPRKPRMEADLLEMETMIAELLEMERLREGRGLAPEPRDVEPILRDAAAPFQDGPPGVRVRTPSERLVGRVDAETLRRVLRNLLDNAVKHALPDSRPIEVSARREGGFVAIRVTDDGPGIPEADRRALFEPFVRLDPSRSRKTGGYGLGLSICKRIVEAHGGEIKIEGHAGRGVTFVVRIREADPG